jgi:hypothetical protein
MIPHPDIDESHRMELFRLVEPESQRKSTTIGRTAQ